MTSKNPHNPDSPDRALDRNNRDDPKDGSGNSDRPGRGAPTAARKPPVPDRKDETAIEAFDDEGAGIAAKE